MRETPRKPFVTLVTATGVTAAGRGQGHSSHRPDPIKTPPGTGNQAVARHGRRVSVTNTQLRWLLYIGKILTVHTLQNQSYTVCIKFRTNFPNIV